jgi:murein L,D-transpeptidase YcbB/YkuD
VSRQNIDFTQFNERNFPFDLKQPPSRRNALGLVKFMFPNKHAVYLHDTSHRELFARSRRAYSSGCIRVHKPMEFAAKLFSESGVSRSKIDRIVDTKKTTRVNLKKAVPVHLAYFTVWVNDAGIPSFYEDIYQQYSIWQGLINLIEGYLQV